MNKNIKSAEVSQARHERKRKKGEISRKNESFVSYCNDQLKRASASIRHEIGSHLQSRIQYFTERKLKMAGVIFYKLSTAPQVRMPRDYLIKCSGYKNPQTASRHVSELEEMGLIEVTQICKGTNHYALGPAAKDEIVRQYLVRLIPSLKMILGISLLLSQNSYSNVSQVSKHKLTSIGIGDKKSKKGTLEQKLFDAFPMFSYIANKYPNKQSLKKENLVLKSLEITEAGIANLLPYPPSAITWADEQLAIALAKGSMKDPFAFLVKKANDWCKERGMRPEWRPMYDAYQSQSITNDMPRFTNILIASPKKTQRSYTAKTEEREINPVPRIDKMGACCYWKTLDTQSRYDYLKKQLGLRPERCDIDEAGGPLPISPHYKDKLTCSHGRDSVDLL